MKIINNRYKIIETIRESDTLVCFLAEDLFGANRKVMLCMVEKTLFSPETYEYIKRYFALARSLADVFFLKSLDFSSVQNMDGVRKDGSFLMYTVEHLPDPISLTDWVGGGSVKRLVEAVAMILKALNYAGLCGFVRSSFALKDLFIHRTEGGPCLRHTDLMSYAMEDVASADPAGIVESELFLGESAGQTVDLKELACFLLSVIEGREWTKNENFAEKIKKFERGSRFGSDHLERGVFEKLLVFIRRLHESDLQPSVDSLNRVFAEYASLFKLSSRIEDSDKVRHLTREGALVGRKNEVEEMMKLALQTSPQESARVVLLKGVQGTGKTRVLREMEHLLSFENILLLSSFRLSKEQPQALLEDFFRSYADLFLSFYFGEKRKSYLERLNEIKEYFVSGQPRQEERHRLKMLLRATTLMFQAMQNQRIVFIVDNFEFADETVVEFLLYFLSDPTLKEKMMLLLSVDPKQLREDAGAQKLIRILSSVAQVKEVTLENMRLQDVRMMIRSTLATTRSKESFVHRIYMETAGNPGLISKALREYMLRGYLRLCPRTGRWEFADERLKREATPKRREDPFRRRDGEKFSESEWEFLTLLACFQGSVRAKRLLRLSERGGREMENFLEKFIRMGIVEGYYDGSVHFVSLSDPYLRERLLTQAPRKKRSGIHEAILTLLDLGEDEDVIEALFQFRSLRKFREGRKLALQTAKSKEKNNPQMAIIFYRKALELTEDDELPEEIAIRLSLAEIYFSFGYVKDCLDVMEKLFSLYGRATIRSQKERILYLRARLAFNLGEVSVLEECGNLAKELLLEGKEKTTALIRQKMEADLRVLKGEVQKALPIYRNIIDRYEELKEHRKIVAECCRLYGSLSAQALEPEERLSYFQKGIWLSDELGEAFESIATMGNIGYFYLTEIYDFNRAIELYEHIFEQSRQNMYVLMEISALHHIGVAYMMKGEMLKAQDYIKKAFQRSLMIDDDGRRAEMLAEIFRCALKSGDFAEFQRLRIEHGEFLEISKRTKDADHFFLLWSDYSFSLGYYSRASAWISKFLGANMRSGSLFVEEWQCVRELNRMLGVGEYEEHIVRKYVEHLKERSDRIERQESVYRLCRYVEILLHRFGTAALEKTIREVLTLEPLLKTNCLRMYFSYFRALQTVERDTEGLRAVLSAKFYVKRHSYEAVSVGICYEIARRLLSLNEQREALPHLADGLLYAVKIMSRIPKEHQASYFNTHQFIRIFRLYERWMEGCAAGPEERESILTQSQVQGILEKYSENFFARGSKAMDAIVEERLRHLGLDPSLEVLLPRLTGGRKKNIRRLLEFFAASILATDAFILLHDGAGNYETLVRFSVGAPYIDMRILAKYLNRGKTVMQRISGEGSVKEYPDIVEMIAIPLPEGKAGRANRVRGFIVFLTDNYLHLFTELTHHYQMMEIQVLIAMIQGYELKQSVSIDPLTGALARKYLFEHLSNVMQSLKRERAISIGIFDLDHFKRVNDSYGHQVGDIVLKTAVGTVTRYLGGRHQIGRYGGEEFIIVFYDLDAQQAWEYGEKLRKEMEKVVFAGYPRLQVTFSMGIRQLDRERDLTPEKWVEKADRALYHAKDTGRNRCIIYTDDLLKRRKGYTDEYAMVTGDEIRDNRVVMALTELTLLRRRKGDLEERMLELLSRGIELFGVQESGVIFLSEKEKPQGCYKLLGEQALHRGIRLSDSLIRRLRYKEEQRLTIDWSEEKKPSRTEYFPIWQSVLAVRITTGDRLRGLLYFRTPLTERMFDERDLNFAKIMSNIAGLYLSREE
ncbi:MAG: diguanylate cyclase [Peptostreptococcaceae bacterium]|nr:diguanylate cyclase [Peptostreptococcaceae bacterium]